MQIIFGVVAPTIGYGIVRALTDDRAEERKFTDGIEVSVVRREAVRDRWHVRACRCDFLGRG